MSGSKAQVRGLKAQASGTRPKPCKQGLHMASGKVGWNLAGPDVDRAGGW